MLRAAFEWSGMTVSAASPEVAIVGSGPAGLMAAHVVAEAGLRARVFEKRSSPGRKLLIAGSSGLNVTFDAPIEEIVAAYAPEDGHMRAILEAYPPAAWLGFIEQLGVRTFKGTSRRWFVEGMKAPPLLGAWVEALRERAVAFAFDHLCSGFEARDGQVALTFADGSRWNGAAAVLCLGGGSWEKPPFTVQPLFERQRVGFSPFRASNAGFRVAWPAGLLAEAEGRPIKNVVVRSSRGARAGDLVITSYGLEGTPIYAVGEVETVHIDLKPDLSLEEVSRRLALPRENLSPMRRARRTLRLGDGALALLFHLAPETARTDQEALASCVKAFPIALLERQPLEEAISSSGGVCWQEIDEGLMLRRQPGVFVAGEMIDWDAPTGGFLVQGCVSTGRWAGRAAAAWVRAHTTHV
ncbi:MAG: TIGR03862 family flavoprotein [Proteobacteria bacterium]|nr:TIGR03862 family flavoprotein [Pseudomonadota bacterium]